MATLAIQTVTRAGLAPAYTAAAGGGDSFLPDPDTFLHVKNGSGGALTVTVITTNVDRLGNAVADNAISIPAAGERMLGPFPPPEYVDPTDPLGLADITYSGVTSLTIAAIKCPRP